MRQCGAFLLSCDLGPSPVQGSRKIKSEEGELLSPSQLTGEVGQDTNNKPARNTLGLFLYIFSQRIAQFCTFYNRVYSQISLNGLLIIGKGRCYFTDLLS
jgi:hypothetical protein